MSADVPVSSVLRLPADSLVRRRIVRDRARDILARHEHTCRCGARYFGRGTGAMVTYWFDNPAGGGPRRVSCRECFVLLP